MSPAIEIRRLHKRFEAGAGSCRAAAHVLRGIDLTVWTAECLAVIGPAGAGKTSLLLCAAGLLAPSTGEVEWFGDAARDAASRRARYHAPGTCWGRLDRAACESVDPIVHLVDLSMPGCGVDAIAWIDDACARGHAVVVASRTDEIAHRLGARVVSLRGGALHSVAAPQTRVAEAAWRRRA